MDGRRALGVPKRQFPWIQLEDSIKSTTSQRGLLQNFSSSTVTVNDIHFTNTVLFNYSHVDSPAIFYDLNS